MFRFATLDVDDSRFGHQGLTACVKNRFGLTDFFAIWELLPRLVLLVFELALYLRRLPRLGQSYGIVCVNEQYNEEAFYVSGSESTVFSTAVFV